MSMSWTCQFCADACRPGEPICDDCAGQPVDTEVNNKKVV